MSAYHDRPVAQTQFAPDQQKKVADLQQNMSINKDIIKTLIEAQAKSGDKQVQLLMEALEKMRLENQQLQEKGFSKKPNNEA